MDKKLIMSVSQTVKSNIHIYILVVVFLSIFFFIRLAPIHAVVDPDQKKIDADKALEERQDKEKADACNKQVDRQWDGKQKQCVVKPKTTDTFTPILNQYLNIIFAGIGVVAAAGAVVAGLQYMSAREDPQKVAQAKERLLNIVIGIVLFVVMYIALQWLVPGGIFR